MSQKETKVHNYLHEWGGTTKGLGSEWQEEVGKKVGRPTCMKCGKYRCSHQIFSGKVAG